MHHWPKPLCLPTASPGTLQPRTSQWHCIHVATQRVQRGRASSAHFIQDTLLKPLSNNVQATHTYNTPPQSPPRTNASAQLTRRTTAPCRRCLRLLLLLLRAHCNHSSVKVLVDLVLLLQAAQEMHKAQRRGGETHKSCVGPTHQGGTSGICIWHASL